MGVETQIDPKLREAFGEMGKDHERASKEFTEKLATLDKKYLRALELDRREDNQEGVKFVWGELNKNVTADDMFSNAMEYLIKAETTQEASTKEFYDTLLENKYGKEGSKSFIALTEMRTAVSDAVAQGSNENLLRLDFHQYKKSKIENSAS